MTHLIRFEVVGEPRFGNLDGGRIVVQDDEFASSETVTVDGKDDHALQQFPCPKIEARPVGAGASDVFLEGDQFLSRHW